MFYNTARRRNVTDFSPRPLLAVPNVTAHQSTANVPITVLLCNGPLLCGFNVGIKGSTYLDVCGRKISEAQSETM